ncbi:MAG: DUF2283 domain-containing protein [Candidatus Woesearchaeota archaeon]
MKKYDFHYDSNYDSLFIHQLDRKSSGSIDMGDIILDYDSNEEFVGIQLLNASELISDNTGETRIKSMLKNLTKCSIRTLDKKGIVTIVILLESTVQKYRSIRYSLVVPDTNYRSQAIA